MYTIKSGWNLVKLKLNLTESNQFSYRITESDLLSLKSDPTLYLEISESDHSIIVRELLIN